MKALSEPQKRLLKRLKKTAWTEVTSREERTAQALAQRGLVQTRRGRLNLWLEARITVRRRNRSASVE